MDNSIVTIVNQLENGNDPQTAFFSFDVDDTGERGVISANAAGLRLYAAELLKKSLQMEQQPPGSLPCKTLCFDKKEWVVSEAGYDLIVGVLPQFNTRQEILSARKAVSLPGSSSSARNKMPGTRNGCMLSLLVIFAAGCITLAIALHWFS